MSASIPFSTGNDSPVNAALYFKIHRFGEADVGRNAVAGFDFDYVSRHEAAGFQYLQLTVPEHFTMRGGHLFQSIERLLGLGLLDHADDGVQKHDGKDDYSVREAFTIHITHYA